jgi:hypothetical protein
MGNNKVANEVPCASCCDILNTYTNAGTMKTPPPRPISPEDAGCQPDENRNNCHMSFLTALLRGSPCTDGLRVSPLVHLSCHLATAICISA